MEPVDFPMYTVNRGDTWEAQILLPGEIEPEQMQGYETRNELIGDLQAKYGMQATRISRSHLEEEIELRMAYSAENQG